MTVRPLLRLAVGGVVCGLAVYGGGLALERVVLGPDAQAIARRAQTETQRAIGALARSLSDAVTAVAGTPALSRATVDEDPDATAKLFAAVDTARGAATALTVYSAGGVPIAWSGHPSELTPDRLSAASDDWFFAQGDLGLRLVHARPVLRDKRRLATVVAEQALTAPEGVRPSLAPVYRLSSAVVPVSIYPGTNRLPHAAGDTAFAVVAPLGAPLGTAVIAQQDVAFVQQRWRRASLSLGLIAFATSVLLLAGPLLDWRNRSATLTRYLVFSGVVGVVVLASRLLFRLASPADWTENPVFSAAAYASPQLRPLLTSPFDFALTGLAAGSAVALLLYAIEATRIHMCHTRWPIGTGASTAAYAVAQLAAGAVLAMLLDVYHRFVADTLANTTLDLLHFSLHPRQSGADYARIVLQMGFVVWHAAALALGVAVLRAAGICWRVGRQRWGARIATVVCWLAPLVVLAFARHMPRSQGIPMIAVVAAVTVTALAATRLKARYRSGSQAFRVVMLMLALVIPALAVYPDVFQLASRAKTQLVVTRYAPQVIHQRGTITRAVTDSLTQIDAVPRLLSRIGALSSPSPRKAGVDTDLAFDVWRGAALAAPVTSSIELYGADGTLVSRFAFNLPEDLSAVRQREEPSCGWDIYEEVSPFFAEDRRVLHAGRALCVDGRPRGSIVVHAVLDYSDLPFISSRSPYITMLRRDDSAANEGAYGRDIEYAVYGWSRTPLYASREPAWPLSEEVFSRAMESRSGFWAELSRDGDRFDVYVMNDRGGIHALGFPVVDTMGHLVNVAEITALVGVTYLLLIGLSLVFGVFSRRGASARALFREVRASFYRKLFLAFVAAAVVPVGALALVTRAYMANQIQHSIESEAVRTASSARRVVEDLIVPRAEEQGGVVDDNLMVWVSRLVGEDINVFTGPRLSATSERNLFASGLLPTRTPAEVYRDLVLRMQASTVSQEQIGGLEYMVVGTPMTATGRRAILTVPLTLRQQMIESEKDTLDRRVLLAVLLFVLAGAAIGYSMAERIADPVNRLTRATRRIAAGDLDARIAATSSDELRRLVQAFNAMASDLQRQRAQLERTNRLEAWAEMARQVAHEIKNPLTPIQLNAEHLRRVHADRGEPMGPVLQECVDTILQQVRLLRQIASEFSNFASSPTAKPADVRVDELLSEILAPYRAGLGERIEFHVDVPASLPPARVDRSLTARAFTNIIENALHAMPGDGELRVHAVYEAGHNADGSAGAVRVTVADTGRGMDDEALARAFEPYFSTKGTGTGLGLPIAKRNIELSGGTIQMASERDRGTTVDVILPVSSAR